MTDLAVETTDLTKRYRGGVLAVDGVNLRVAQGEIYAFLGLNGAGKSTTIRMLLGMIRPTAGHAEIFGQLVTAGATNLWRRVGHLVESATAYPELTVRDNLDIARRLAGMTDPSAVDSVIERLALGMYADRRAGTLSLGNLQRLALARALLPAPDLLVLDEPANGLDPAGVDRDPRADPGPCDGTRRHRVHVEPHPRRGRPARHADRDRASRAPGGGTGPRRAWTPSRSPTRSPGEGSRSGRGRAPISRPLAGPNPAGRPRAT